MLKWIAIGALLVGCGGFESPEDEAVLSDVSLAQRQLRAGALGEKRGSNPTVTMRRPALPHGEHNESDEPVPPLEDPRSEPAWGDEADEPVPPLEDPRTEPAWGDEADEPVPPLEDPRSEPVWGDEADEPVPPLEDPRPDPARHGDSVSAQADEADEPVPPLEDPRAKDGDAGGDHSDEPVPPLQKHNAMRPWLHRGLQPSASVAPQDHSRPARELVNSLRQ